jgi:hemerythrin-like domain-containing protein
MELASLAQLERCHRRHDQVMAGLLEAARRLAAGRPDDGDLDLVHDAVAYFERAVTRHFVDEDGSVFPRLSTRRPELAQALAELSAEHPVQIAMQADVAAAVHELDGEARPAAGKTLLDAATRLAAAHRAHVGREDEIFAAAHEALTAEDDAEISAEMETRRGREDNGGHRGDRRRGERGAGHGTGTGGGRGRARAMPHDGAEAKKPAPARRAAKRASNTVAKRAVAARSPTKRAAPGSRAASKAASKRATPRPAAKRSTSRPAAKRGKPSAGSRGKR